MRPQPLPDVRYRIRFESLKDDRRALEFLCDSEGRVELDELSERDRVNYLFARVVVGGEFRRPAVVQVTRR